MQIPYSNTSEAFETWAKNIAANTGFKLDEKIYQGTYYTAEYVRTDVVIHSRNTTSCGIVTPGTTIGSDMREYGLCTE